MNGFIIEKVELESDTLNDFEARIIGVVRIRPVSQAASRAAQCMWTFALNAEGHPVGGCIPGCGPKPERSIEGFDVHWLRAKHASRLEVVLSRKPQRPTGASSASVEGQPVVPSKSYVIRAVGRRALAINS